jgi:Na+/melibiose symporter-like transporter
VKVSRENATIVGVGAVACAACCAAPILGFLAAIGLGTAVGFAMFGSVALVFGAIAIAVVLRRRRRRARAAGQATVKSISTRRAGMPMS